MSKPGDFFVGITDLFSILLPGMCITFVYLKLTKGAAFDPATWAGGSEAVGYVAFLIVAYVLGHLMDMIGAFFCDALYDKSYARRKRQRPDGTRKDALYEEAKRLASPAMVAEDRVYQWSRSWTCLKSPSAFTEIERIQAHSKFFRGLVSVFLLSAVLLLLHRPLQLRFVGMGGLCTALSSVAFLRFCDLRWKVVQQT